MTSIPIYTGQWTDWSRGELLGRYRTYSVTDTNYIIGGTSAFVTFVGGSAWVIYAFFLHRFLATRGKSNLISLQHRSIYRNDSTAQAAIIDAFFVCWAWKPWGLCHPRRRSRGVKNKSIILRSSALICPALIIFLGFTAASVTSSLIAAKPYLSQTVLVSNGFNKNQTLNQCGITLFDGSLASNEGYDSKVASDTRAAVSYSRSCYSTASGSINPVSCSFFATAKLNYTSEAAECPFGDTNLPFSQSICNFQENTKAHRVTTALLDSHDDFGINAPPSDRLKVFKQLTCSPLSQEGLTSIGASHGSESNCNFTVTDFNYGEVPNLSKYTYQYNPAAAYDNVPFQISTLLHNATGPETWIVISNISRADADVTIIFAAPNSIKYRKPVTDPFFKATYNVTIPIANGENLIVYSPASTVSIMGCAEQYSICIDQNHCTTLGGQEALGQKTTMLGLNNAQFVTAQRMIYMIANANTYSSVNGIGPDAFKAWSTFLNFLSPGIPENQWKIEVEGWFETTLARWQAFMVEFAANTADDGLYAHIGFPMSNSTLDTFWQNQCANQKINNVGSYQNVSVFGLAFVWTVGGFLVLFSFVFKIIFFSWPGSKERWVAWNIDGKFQQNRLALHSAGYHELIGGKNDVPYTETELKPDLPFKDGFNEERGNTLYVPNRTDNGSHRTSRDGRRSFEGLLPEQRRLMVLPTGKIMHDTRGFELPNIHPAVVQVPALLAAQPRAQVSVPARKPVNSAVIR